MKREEPLMDSPSLIERRLLEKGQNKGVLYDEEIEKALAKRKYSSEQIEDVKSRLTEEGVEIVLGEGDAAEGGEPAIATKETTESIAGEANKPMAEIGRTEDPVRIYLREMGNVSLLTREQEVSIAKRD